MATNAAYVYKTV